MKTSYIYYISVFALLLVSVVAHADAENNRLEGTPFITNFSAIEYNGEAQNWNFVQDHDDVLYIANTSGILSYDGSSWRTLRMLNNAFPISFAKDATGKIYIGGFGFLGYIQPNESGFMEFVSLNEHLPPGFDLKFVRSCFFRSGKVFFQCPTHLLIWDQSKLVVVESAASINMLLQDQSDLFLSTKKGLYAVHDNELLPLDPFHNLSDVHAIVSLNDKSQLVATYQNGLYLFASGILEPVLGPTNDFLAEMRVQSATLLPDGNLAFATKKAGVLITDQQLQPQWRLCQQTGMQDDDVKRVFVDHEGNLWMANNRGISKVNYPISSTQYDVLQLGLGTVEEITYFQSVLHIGTYMGTYRLEPSSSSALLSADVLPAFVAIPGSSVENFVLGKMNDYLLFGGADGLKIYDGHQSNLVLKTDPRKIVCAKFQNQTMYMVHSEGCSVLKFEGNRLIEEIKLDIPNFEYRGVLETKEGHLWLTTLVNGVYFAELGKDFEVISLIHYTVEDGLPALSNNLVYEVSGQTYFTTMDGIYHFDSQTQSFIPDTDFGPFFNTQSKFVYSFDSDSTDQFIWINALNTRETKRMERNENGIYQTSDEYFGLYDAMQIYDIMAMPDGSAWLGGAERLVKYQDTEWKKSRPNLNIKIREVRIGQDSVVFGGVGSGGASILSATSRAIRFAVAALSFDESCKMKYQFQMEGMEDEWSAWEDEPFRYYSNLSNGDYVFRVRAKSSDGRVTNEASYAFFIQPFWYETWWFRFIIVMTSAFLLGFVIKFFSQRKLIKRVEELDAIRRVERQRDEAIIKEKEKGIAAMIIAQEEERQRIARDLHDGIVQEIGSLIIRWRNLFSEDKPNVQSASKLLSALEQSNVELRALSHQMMPKTLSAVGIVAALEGLLEGSLKPIKIDFEYEHFGIEARLPENIEITLYRVCQELVQNIIKHSNASLVNVQLFKAGTAIHLVVEDNGTGFNLESNNEGIGIQNVRSRIAMLIGTVNFEPSPQNGTLVTVNIPC